MPNLGTLRESRERLSRHPPRDQPHHATQAWCTRDVCGLKRSFARAQLKALGFTDHPSWDEVLDRVAQCGRMPPRELSRHVAALLDEPDDCVRLAVRPRHGTIPICTGAHGIIDMPVTPPHHRLMLETEIVYLLA